jgi:predicted MPP superfamily phosphohydrolase
MWIYLLLLIVVAILLVISSISFVRFIHKIVDKYIKNKVLSWIISLIPLLLFIIGIVIDMVNAIVVYIHLIVIIWLTKLVFLIIKKLTKKEINNYIILTIGILLSTVILINGYFNAYNVKETNYVLYTEKDIGTDNFRIVQISDSHIGATFDGKTFSNYMEEVNKLNPDIVVLTGDFIDDNTNYDDMKEAASGLGKLKTKYGTYFIFGNHDKGYYSDRGTKLREELEKNNVIVLEDKCIGITDKITIVGRQDKSVRNRVDAINLTKDINKDKYIIMLDHQPNDYDNEKEAEVDLVLSGHTHGGQLIPLGYFGLLLKANDRVYGIETRDKTTFIVNSGISDWAIKFKTGTKSEYGVIDIKNK